MAMIPDGGSSSGAHASGGFKPSVKKPVVKAQTPRVYQQQQQTARRRQPLQATRTTGRTVQTPRYQAPVRRAQQTTAKTQSPQVRTTSRPAPAQNATPIRQSVSLPISQPSIAQPSGLAAQPVSAPAVAQPVAPPVQQFQTLTIPDAKADPNYQSQVSGLAKALTDYQAQNQLAQSQYTGQYDTTLRNLGYDQKAGWQTQGNGQYAQDFGADQNDFAGRGAYYSSPYAQSISNMLNQYNQQKGQLDTNKTNYLQSQNLALNQYGSQNALDQQAALRDAANRIAAQYGIDYTQVPQGTGSKQITVPVKG